MKKKILSLFLVVFLAIVAIGCNFSGGKITIEPSGDEPATTIDLDEVFLNIESQIPNRDSLTGDITLPTKFGQVAISWVSDNPIVIDANGHVTRPDVDTTVILRCTLVSPTETKRYEVHVIVKAKENTNITPEYVLAKLDADKQGTYYGDGVVVVVEESKVTITEPNGKVLTFDIYIENDQYFVLEEGTKIICTFGDGSVTNSKGTFTKTQPTPTPVVAHLDTTKQGTYYGDGVVVVIGESEVSVTDATGKVLKYTIYVEDNKYYVLDGDTKDYCTFGDGTVTNSKGTFTKTPPTPTSYTISDVKAGEIGKTYNIKATVVAVSAVSFLLQDDTDTILVYLGASYEKDLAVGDEIEFSGKTGTYSGTIQFTTAQYTKLGTKTISYPQPTVLSASDIDALVSATPVTQYVKVEAVLKISGNYLNLEFEGTKAIGSLVRPVDSLLDYNNKVVIVTGYYLYVTGSSTKYVNFLMTEIEESSTPAPQLEDVTIAVVLAGEVGERYRTMGTIVAVSAVSLVLQDETGAIVCNFGSDFAYSTYRIGLKMAVEGPTQLHGGSVQINYPQVALLTEVGANYPVPRELEFNDLLELNGQAPEYVMLTGKLVKSGNYYNLDMGDPYIFGALATPTEDIDGFVGKDIVVKGFYDYTTTSGDKTYVYFIYTSIEVVAASNGDEEIVDEIIASYTDFEFMDVVNNLLLPEGSDGVTMTWVSTNEDVLESNGTYHMPSEPTDVTFILTVSKGEVSKSTNVTFHVVGVESIASVKENTEYGSYHIIKGITIATAREGFVLQDETGMIYCSTASYRGDLQVGDEVIVKGPTQLYGNIVQIAKYELNYEKTGEKVEVTFPEAIALDADAFASLFETTDIIFVQVSGTLEAGEYLSILNVEGTEIVGGLLHPNLMEYDGMDITVKGYFIDSVWGYKQFNQIVVTDVTVDSASNVDQNKVTRVVEDITKSFDGQKMYYPVNYYPDFEDVTVTWTSSNEDVFAIGEITKYQDTETVVTLTAVVECGEVSQTVVVNVIVPAITPTTGVTADDSEQTFVVCGTIVAATNESVLLQDNAGTILIYFGKYQCPEVLSVGAKIYYVGTVTTYAGIIEFNFGGYYVIEYLDVDYPEAIELNGEGCEALVDTTEVKYVKITGDLLINGSYVNFYPVGSELALSIISPNEDLTELNNYRITLTGYYVYTSGSSTKYPSIMMTDYEVYEWSDEEIVADIKATIDGLVGYTLYGGVSFTYRDDVDITWSSSNEAIIANDLTYNAPDSDTEVTLTATITKGEVTDTATVTFLCKGIVSIASIKASEDLSQKFVIKGNVLAVSQISFIVQDGSGYIYVYYGSNFAQDLEIGDEVVVRGYVSIYNELYEFSSEVGYTKTGESITVTNTPDELDGEAFDLLGNTTGFRYIKITGDYYYDGRYHTFYPLGSESCVANLVRPLVDGLDEVNGERLIITGYYCFAEGQDPRYLNIVVTGFEVYEWTDEELVNDAVRSINDIQNYPLLAGVTITFGDRYTVTWTSSNEDILSSSFEYHVPEVDTLVTMTATITVGEVTDTASCTFLCKAPSTIASVIASQIQDERMLVKGTVIAVSATCFLVEDDTAKILVYYGDKFAQDLEVGDEVYVRGYLTTYNGTLQFGANVGYEKTGEKNDVEYPSPLELDSAGFDALLDTTDMKYVKVTGQLRMFDGYYNFYVSGSDLTGSIVSPTDEKLKFADGTYVTITGYYLYTTGSSTKYISILATSLEYEEVEPIYGYYLTGTEFANWQLNVEYKLNEAELEGDIPTFNNTYVESELAALLDALEARGVSKYYYMEVEINQITDTWTDYAIINGGKVELSGSFAFKVLYGYEVTSGATLEKWIPSEVGGRVESLTPATVFASDNWQDEVDSNGFNWNSNLMVTNGMGKYLVVFADYNTESSMEQAGYGIALIKAVN